MEIDLTKNPDKMSEMELRAEVKYWRKQGDWSKTGEVLTRRLTRANQKNEKLTRQVKRLERKVADLEGQLDFA